MIADNYILETTRQLSRKVRLHPRRGELRHITVIKSLGISTTHFKYSRIPTFQLVRSP